MGEVRSFENRSASKTHVRADPRGGSPSDKQEGEWATVRLLLPRSGYAPQQSRGLRRLESPPRATTTLSAASSWPGGVSSMRLHALPRRPAVKWVASMLGSVSLDVEMGSAFRFPRLRRPPA